MRYVTAISIGCAATLMLMLGGCRTDRQKQMEADQIIVGVPLEHDPTERFELPRWWSNGTHLLRLDANAAYTLHQGTNRYSRPLERGRWSQQSYAVLWLEPYDTIKVEPRRVSITKIDGRLALIVPKLEPMIALSQPPQVLEDQVIGLWEGPMGALHLTSDLRYVLTPNEGDGERAIRLGSFRKGRWRIVNEQLVLHSDIPGVEPLVLPVLSDGPEASISAPGGPLTKREPPADGNATTTG
jgi:hypothetical protein